MLSPKAELCRLEATKYLQMCRVLAERLPLEEQADVYTALIEDLVHDRELVACFKPTRSLAERFTLQLDEYPN